MVTEAVNIKNIPYRGLKKPVSLVSFDRVVLSLFSNENNEQFLLYLFDSNDSYDDYLLWKVQTTDLYSFLHKGMSLRDVIISNTKEFLFLIRSDYENLDNLDDSDNYQYVHQILLSEISEDWMPDEDSYWDFPIPDEISVVLENFAQDNYVEMLRDKATYFIVEPRHRKYGTTVSSLDASGFLIKLTNSFLNFALFDFSTKFNYLFIGDNGFQNSQEQLKSSLVPRVAYAGYSSFEVALSVDSLNPILEGNEEFFNWQNQIIKLYKEEIIDLNYGSISAIDTTIEKYPVKVRKQIFGPLFEIADNPHYTVEVSDRRKTFRETIYPVDKETKKRITISSEEITEQEPEGLELMTFVMAVPQGSNLNDINKQSIRRNVLSVSKSDTKETQYQESFTFKGRNFNAISPLTLRLAIRGQIFILLCDVFSIEANSNDNFDLYRKLESEIYNYYLTKVANNLNSSEAKIFHIYFEVS